MNAPINPVMAAIYAKELADARELDRLAYEYVEAMEASGGKHNALQLRCWVALLQHLYTVTDGNIGDALEVAEQELTEAIGLPEIEGPSFGTRHPDHPGFGARA